MASGRAGGRADGLTLLEVLAAVAVLGLLYTVLAGVAMQGLRAEGESQRRIRASLLADRALGEREATLGQGDVPELGGEETEEDGFTVAVSVAPFRLDLPPDELAPADKNPQGASFLAPTNAAANSPLLRIDVRVAWIEGQDELAVTRTTFAFDTESVRPMLESLDRANEAAAEQARNPLAPGARSNPDSEPAARTGGLRKTR